MHYEAVALQDRCTRRKDIKDAEMKPRLDIRFPCKHQWRYWSGKQYEPRDGEYLLNHARAGIVLALQASLPKSSKVGVVAYNCHTVANAVVQAGYTPIFVDVTDNLTIDITSVPADLDAIVVTNLFGIRNDIKAIRKRCPNAIIIVDNAHGYGLPAEGDFTVYSINQGKFPSLGEGGILSAIDDFKFKIDDAYENLPSYSFVAQVKLFAQMLVKAIAYSRCIYWLTMKVKESSNLKVHQAVVMRKMAPGVRRMFEAWLPSAEADIVKQKRNAESIINLKFETINSQCIIGANAFMVVVRTDDPEELKRNFAKRGIETETHFAHAIDWAKEFGYQAGACPNAEYLTKHLLMIPTYYTI